jgi:hypothetical protein
MLDDNSGWMDATGRDLRKAEQEKIAEEALDLPRRHWWQFRQKREDLETRLKEKEEGRGSARETPP